LFGYNRRTLGGSDVTGGDDDGVYCTETKIIQNKTLNMMIMIMVKLTALNRKMIMKSKAIIMVVIMMKLILVKTKVDL
jgi:hypothetical protein